MKPFILFGYPNPDLEDLDYEQHKFVTTCLKQFEDNPTPANPNLTLIYWSNPEDFMALRLNASEDKIIELVNHAQKLFDESTKPAAPKPVHTGGLTPAGMIKYYGLDERNLPFFKNLLNYKGWQWPDMNNHQFTIKNGKFYA